MWIGVGVKLWGVTDAGVTGSEARHHAGKVSSAWPGVVVLFAWHGGVLPTRSGLHEKSPSLVTGKPHMVSTDWA